MSWKKVKYNGQNSVYPFTFNFKMKELLLSLILGSVTLIQGSNDVCGDIFFNSGYNISTFAAGVGHGLHSLSLEEIRFYFDEDASEDNNIPTVNINLKDENAVLDHALLRGYEDRFHTWALKIMDWFMLNNNKHLLQKVHKHCKLLYTLENYC